MSDDASEGALTEKAKPAAGEAQVNGQLCKACGLCAEYCPQDLLRPATEIPADDRDGPVMNPSGHVVYAVYDPEGRCTGCGICANVCPEGAVVVYRRKKTASESRSIGTDRGNAAVDPTPDKKEDAHV